MEQKPKILVTGGAGFIGSHTVVELIEAGYHPIVIDNLSNSDISVIQRLETLTQEKIPFHNIDCCDINAMRNKIKSYNNIQGIIHFAAYKSVNESVKYPSKYYRNNLVSLLNILQLKEEFQIQKFIFSSSCTVYGKADVFPVTELSPIKPAESPYGYTKQVGEQMVKDHCNENAIILRYFNPIGAHPSGLIGESPNGKPENLIPYLTKTAANILPILSVFGNDYQTKDGTCIRDYIHVCDLARAHVLALNSIKETTPTEVINVGTGNGHSVLEAIKTFEAVTGVKVNYQIVGKRDGDIPAIYADNSKAKKLLQWSDHYSFADALMHAWLWQKAQIIGAD